MTRSINPLIIIIIIINNGNFLMTFSSNQSASSLDFEDIVDGLKDI